MLISSVLAPWCRQSAWGTAGFTGLFTALVNTRPEGRAWARMKGGGRLNPIPLKEEQASEGSANRLSWGEAFRWERMLLRLLNSQTVVKKKS